MEIQNLSFGKDDQMVCDENQSKPHLDKALFEVTHSSFSHGVTTKAGRLGKSTGRWTKHEHFLFVEGKKNLLIGLRIFNKNWKRVEVLLPTWTGT